MSSPIWRSTDTPNMIGPIPPGTYEYKFDDKGLEIWLVDKAPEDKVEWFTISNQMSMYAVYGTKTENLTIVPLRW